MGKPKKIPPEVHHILYEKGSEMPYSGKYWNCEEEGIYVCAGCGVPLFSSEAKYDSKTGWPSFSHPIEKDAVTYKDDVGFFSKRIEVCCAKCAGHLGHLFGDGPKPDKTRYCINSLALNLKKK